MIASDTDPDREPAPVGALFEAAFRRYGARITSYTLYSIATAAPPAIAVLVLRPSPSHVQLGMLSAIVGAALFGHFLLVGTLTALVTGTLRARIGAIGLASAIAAALIGAGFAVAGPFVAVAYPPLVFAPIAAAAGDAGPIRSFVVGGRLALRDWGRSFGVLVGLSVIVAFCWIAFQISLTPVGGDAQGVAVMVLTFLLVSPIAALVERNLYGDLTGRVVLPPTVSRSQSERGKKPRRRRGRA